MAGTFYARYVPPGTSTLANDPLDQVNGQKRKYEDPVNDRGVDDKKQKKQRIKHEKVPYKQSTGLNGDVSIEETNLDRNQDVNSPATKTTKRLLNENVLSKYSATQYAQSLRADADIKSQRNARPDNPSSHLHDTEVVRGNEASPEVPSKEWDHNAQKVIDEGAEGDSRNIDKKYSSVLSKFNRSKRAASTVGKTNDEVSGSVPQELHGLEPLPQPAPTPMSVSKPTYSTLPSWLSEPTRVSSLDRKKFAELGIHGKILRNLEAQGMTEAFSVQTTALPLMLEGDRRYNGDICVSAATGSGKTLAYVLPMIQALMGYETTRLRGLIVVPTRELVKQAREVCELCTAGTGLKIASAVGSKSLKDEEAMLVESHEEFRSSLKSDEVGYAKDWAELDLRTLMSQEERKDDDHFMKARRQKIDVLICTPGRLVEHLRSTKGFHLGHLEWLVVDEADRLMNESFQEWVEVVIPALNNQDLEDQLLTNKVLKQIRLPSPQRNLQKVILSATFSEDISKLNSLQLRNPKLLVVGDHQVATGEEAHGVLHLPSSLTEYAVPVGDGTEKPLFLLELLQRKMQKTISTPDTRGVVEDVSSDSDATSSDSEETSSSEDRSFKDEPVTSRMRKARCLVFAASTESAQRLFRLLTILDPDMAEEIGVLTKTSTSLSRQAISLLRRGKISVLIATDRASRGLDIPELEHVVSYDVPNSITTYLHRVGRTARAGKAGDAWTLVAHREARWFWTEIGKAMGEVKLSRSGKVQKLAIELDDDEDMKDRYEKALVHLGEEVKEGRSSLSWDE